MPDVNRRQFFHHSAVALAAASVTPAAFAADAPTKAAASERLRVGCIGVAGRAAALVHGFASLKEVEVARLYDIDRGRLDAAADALEKRTGKKPSVDDDFRRMIDDKSIDAVVVGTPDHWHAIPTILACLAGKDVYVEKPDGHNIVEG